MATDITGEEPAHTPVKKVRVPDPLWEAYESVCRRVLGKERSEDLLDHMRAVIREQGNAKEIALLEIAEKEIAERRARKGGRPRKPQDETMR